MLTSKLAARALSCRDEMVGRLVEKPARVVAPMVASMSVLSAVMLAAPVLSWVRPCLTVPLRLMLASGASRSV